jgi:hypothetical protein
MNNDPKTWGTYQQALAVYERGECDGIGFELSGTEFAAFDIDNCRDPGTGEIAPEGMEIVKRCTSYTECTVSGTGLRVIGFGHGSREEKIHRKQKIPNSGVEVESYRSPERYIVITGIPLADTWPHVADIGYVMDDVVAELDGRHSSDGSFDFNTARKQQHDFSGAELPTEEPGADGKPQLLLPLAVKHTTPVTSEENDTATGKAGEHRESSNSADADATFSRMTLPEDLQRLIFNGPGPNDDHSRVFHRAVCWLGELGWSATRIETLIAGKPIVPERYANRLRQEIERCLRNAKRKQSAGSSGNGQADSSANGQANSCGVLVNDFWAHMPSHQYIYSPTGEMWPASSVNSRVQPIMVSGKAVLAGQWLDRNRAVEQMTWVPGLPQIISDRLMADGGWIEREGTNCFNLYKPPTIKLGDATKAGPWIDHIHKIYPDDADHIINWLAQRVQRPHDKINHALVLGGEPGIGKDTLLEPVKPAVGAWNFKEASPAQIMGRFNPFLKAVILRISETRDQGEHDRFKFYDHTKVMIAAPPDTHTVDDKHVKVYSIPNVCGVILTTNHQTDGIYLPREDRRHYVAWSDLTKDDFSDQYFGALYDWYSAGGFGDVAAYLHGLDISGFNAKAPPPKTPAFWQIVTANQAAEDAELADIIERLGNPDAITLNDLAMEAQQVELVEWLRDRKNRRAIGHRLYDCGYLPVRNDVAKDGLWRIRGKRQAIYAKRELSVRDRIAAANKLARQ